jgi:hypothetical protein
LNDLAGRAAPLLAATLLAACVHLGTPAPGEPVEARDGRGTVFGRISVGTRNDVVPPANPGADWHDVGPGLRAELRVHLLRLEPRQVILPPVWDGGMFLWQLPPGDYLLVGMPAEDQSEEPMAQHHWPLAALRVPPGPGATCAGDLLVDMGGETVVLPGVIHVEAAPARVEVMDACSLRTREIEARFLPLALPARTVPMVSAVDLGFEDPGLARQVRHRLDAAGQK